MSIWDKPTRCSYCRDPAVTVYYFDRGTIQHPNDTVQKLCKFEDDRVKPLGGCELIKDLRPNVKRSAVNN